MSPKIYLAIDNCFASKRWTEPEEWMSVIRDLGLSYAEASADNECDPLYAGDSALRKWAEKCRNASIKTGVEVANLYSGHGTYATLGLAHTEKEIRDRFLNLWLKPMAKLAGSLQAGLGFFCHAFADSILQNPELYQIAETDLYQRMAELAAYGKKCGCGMIGVEQMYTPHQIPWTLRGGEKLLREVYRRGNNPFYLTIDVGHQCGQQKFLRPNRKTLMQKNTRWFGSLSAWRMFEQKESLETVEREMDRYPYLFACREDGNPYLWLEKFGCYSPIIHLQQNDGTASSHLPFTEKHNANGIITAEKVLHALVKSYQKPIVAGMPERCEKIYLTLEIFSGTAELNYDIISKLRESVVYWRQFIPEDGLSLEQLEITGYA